MIVLTPFIGLGQLSNKRVREIPKGDTISLDSMSIYPFTFQLFCDDELIAPSLYDLNSSNAQLILKTSCNGRLIAEYEVMPFQFGKQWQLYDSSVVRSKEENFQDRFRVTPSMTVSEAFGGNTLSKSGSISRGVTFGNNQDLGINSSLNLELAGRIGPNLNLLASLSDDNLPIQPEGNTNKLQEFDQVFIQVYNNRIKLIGGDFWLYKPKSYFMTYKKRAQGLSALYHWTEDSTSLWTTQLSGALSKGKFNRQIIQGVEGNQGPYRLRGAENEPFIILLAGTERVYIDGRLLDRGQEFDYIIDYNTSELTFTARNQITKDSRIVVEFQYSDQNYARSLVQTSTTYKSKKMDFWFNAYSEQDAKNQTLQQELSNSQRLLLTEIGDTLSLARTSSIDSIGFFENQNLYALIDTLIGVTVYDSVLVFSGNPDSAMYRATFEYVGSGQGDYILEGYNALGKVYKWVEPVGGISSGDYEPSRLIVTPKKKQMVNTGMRYNLTEKLKLETELAFTNNDLNTFSIFNNDDNYSIGLWAKLQGDVNLGRSDSTAWLLRMKMESESRERNFEHIEQYRTVEFDRDWNTRGKNYRGNQYSNKVGFDFRNKRYGNINLEGQQYAIGNDYSGMRAAADGKWQQSGFKAVWDGSALNSASESENSFVRHRADVSQNIGFIKIGYKDDHELNKFRDTALTGNSYQFFDYQFYVQNGDSIKNTYKLFYRERIDDRLDGSLLSRAAKARTYGGEIKFDQWEQHQLNIVTGIRKLDIIDTTLIDASPENTLLGRIDYQTRLLKNALTFSNFLEIGSGLEQKQEFLYIQVNDGQGVYTWIDYNNDGIKDLNEFEIAQYVDQASYIRVFTPSSSYVKTFSNEVNQSLYWRPERIWSKKEGVLKFLSRFSDQARVRIKRKTSQFQGLSSLNPYDLAIPDSNMISTNYNVRNTVFFNRLSQIFGVEYNYQNMRSKTLLASGFDARGNEFHELKARVNIRAKFTIEMSANKGIKLANADYTSGRNYDIQYFFLEPSLIYQPNTVFRVSLDGRYSEKNNDPSLGGEKSTVAEIGTELKYSQAEKGMLQANVKMLRITYDGNQNSALGFEMLEALKPGNNFTWNVSYQRTLGKNLQLSIQYLGRKSENNKTIHSGGMEVRAFF